MSSQYFVFAGLLRHASGDHILGPYSRPLYQKTFTMALQKASDSLSKMEIVNKQFTFPLMALFQ